MLSEVKTILARKKPVKIADLRKEMFILREAGSATRAAVAHHLKKADLEVETVMEMENPESVKEAVQSDWGSPSFPGCGRDGVESQAPG